MSERLMGLVQAFLAGKSDAEVFVDSFIALWKQERDSGELHADSSQVSEALSSIFCLADMFNPDPERDEYELDESQLRIEIGKLLKTP